MCLFPFLVREHFIAIIMTISMFVSEMYFINMILELRALGKNHTHLDLLFNL